MEYSEEFSIPFHVKFFNTSQKQQKEARNSNFFVLNLNSSVGVRSNDC